MTPLGRAAACVAVAAAALGAWSAARAVAGARSLADTGPALLAAPTTAEYDASTVVLAGELSSRASGRIARHTREGRAILVVLRGPDRLVCEDLGRQLRELLRRAGPDYPAVVLVAPADEEDYRRFMRREHVPATIETLAPEHLLTSGTDLPTPAVLVTRDGAHTAEGVGHTRRFPNLRLRSFADEMAPLLR
jgi:hypothetical protein